MIEINNELKKYIEENIFPEYQKNEKAHNIEHIKYVINRSFKFAETVDNIIYDIVYTVAAFHDIGHHIDPKRHEIISAEIMMKDENLKRFFSLVNLFSDFILQNRKIFKFIKIYYLIPIIFSFFYF